MLSNSGSDDKQVYHSHSFSCLDKKTRLPNLDSLRALAFLSVFLSHAVLFLGFKGGILWEKISRVVFIHGDLGVNFFFVLSGFLISLLLLQEKKSSGKIKIGRFYMRRILRIWPIYWITLLLGISLIPWVAHLLVGESINNFITVGYNVSVNWKKVPWFFFFLGNIDMAILGSAALQIAILWSVSVEEQFYAIWPWIIKQKRKFILAGIMVGIFISFLIRMYFAHNYHMFSFFSLSIMSDLLVGSALAFFVFDNRNWAQKIINNGKKFSLLLIMLLVLFILFRSTLISWFLEIGTIGKLLYAISPLIFSVICAGIILDQVFNDFSLFKIDNIKFLNIGIILEWLGLRSYGLYCYHTTAVVLVMSVYYALFGSFIYHSYIAFIILFVLVLSFSILIASLSYKYIEAPFLERRKKYY